jgi:toxic protein SymE
LFQTVSVPVYPQTVSVPVYPLRKLKDDPTGAGRPVPWIQLKGYWLQQAGFEINTSVKVRVMNGCLVLTSE